MSKQGMNDTRRDGASSILIYLKFQLHVQRTRVGLCGEILGGGGGANRLQALERLNRVGEGGVGVGEGVTTKQGTDSSNQQLNVLDRVVSLDFLVEVAVEGNSLHVIRFA